MPVNLNIDIDNHAVFWVMLGVCVCVYIWGFVATSPVKCI
jgi:hypothetical protein